MNAKTLAEIQARCKENAVLARTSFRATITEHEQARVKALGKSVPAARK